MAQKSEYEDAVKKIFKDFLTIPVSDTNKINM